MDLGGLRERVWFGLGSVFLRGERDWTVEMGGWGGGRLFIGRGRF